MVSEYEKNIREDLGGDRDCLCLQRQGHAIAAIVGFWEKYHGNIESIGLRYSWES